MNQPEDRATHGATTSTDASSTTDARRGFFIRFATAAISLLLGLIPAGIGLGFILDPILRKRRSGETGATTGNVSARKDADGFLRLDIRVQDLPVDGTPVAYKVFDDKVDAWNKYDQIEVGTVWLRRTDNDRVLALSSVCPHLGCGVDYRAAKSDFFCPCHTSSFNLDGEKTNSIPPRPMDELEVRTKSETGDTIWLKYQNFRGSTPEKIAIS